MNSLLSKLSFHPILNVTILLFRVFLFGLLFIFLLPGSSLAASVSASLFSEGVLNVDFGPPPIQNGFWRISIIHKPSSFQNNTLRACGPGVTGFGPCGGEIDSAEHFEKDYTASFLSGALVSDFRLVVNIESMDASGSPTGNTGTFNGLLQTPPLTFKVGGGNFQTGLVSTQLENLFTVNLSRLGQALTIPSPSGG